MKKIQKLIQWIVLSFFGSTIFFVILYRFVPVPVTPLMFIRCAQQVGRGEKIRLKHHWVPLDEMSKYLPVAVMASEDQRFLQHHGFDVVEIQNAVEERMAGKRRRGGSTISQQTGRPAEKLTRANCALIAATLPNPLKYSSKNPSRYMLKRQTAIMRQMKHIDLFK